MYDACDNDFMTPKCNILVLKKSKTFLISTDSKASLLLTDFVHCPP